MPCFRKQNIGFFRATLCAIQHVSQFLRPCSCFLFFFVFPFFVVLVLFLLCRYCFAFIIYSVGCLWHSHGKNPVRLYPKLQSQPVGLRKIFIDYLFFQADQSDCIKSVSIFNRFASSEELVAFEFYHSWFRMAC